MFDYLAKILPPNCKAVEIGVFKGAFSKSFLRSVQPSKLILVDPWQVVTDEAHRNAWYHADRGIDMEAMYKKIFERYQHDTRVDIFREHSSTALPKLADKSYDFIFVDGDHRYFEVLNDLKNSFAKLCSGGFLLVDDYQMGPQFWWGDDVIRATNDFLNSVSNQIVSARLIKTQLLVKKV